MEPNPAPDGVPEARRGAANDIEGDEQPREVEGTRISTLLGPLPADMAPQRTRDLNAAVHQILIVGLAISTVLLVAGVLLEILAGSPLPAHTLTIGNALREALALHPAGVLTLGLLVLMFTPLVRVIASVGVFVFERDWRYAGITLIVLLVMTVSLIVGEG